MMVDEPANSGKTLEKLTGELAATKHSAQRANDRLSDHVKDTSRDFGRMEAALDASDKKHEKAHETVIAKLDGLREYFVSKEEFKPVKMVVYGIVALLLTAFVTALVSTVVIKKAKADWRSELNTPGGTNCCGIRDCRPMARGFWVKVGDRITVKPGQEPTTITIVHPSQDHRVWVCTTGCAFQPGTS